MTMLEVQLIGLAFAVLFFGALASGSQRTSGRESALKSKIQFS